MTEHGAAARRARWDFREVNVLLVVVLAALTGVIGVIGWWYRPGTSAYPTVRRSLALTVDADARSLVLTLTRVGADGAVLTIYDDDRFYSGASAHGVTPGGWSVGIDGLGAGRVVRRPRGPGVPIPPDQSPMDHDPVPIPRVHGGPTERLTDIGHQPALTYEPESPTAPLYLQIRWARHAPVRVDGAYLSAQIPSVRVFFSGAPPAALPLATTLAPRAGDVGRFSVQATTGPVTAARTWEWHLESEAIPPPPNGGQTSASFEPIALSAVNVSQTQQESARAFLSGVLLGVAGGAVIGVIAELARIRRRRDEGGAAAGIPTDA